MQHPKTVPSLVFADANGNITEFLDLDMAGMSNGEVVHPALEDLIPLPEGSELFTLPGRLPVAWDPLEQEPVLLDENPYEPGESVQAVAAFMAPAHTAILSTAYQSMPDSPLLPLFSYGAVGWAEDRFWVAAFRSDDDIRQDFVQFDQDTINRKTTARLKKAKDNRLIQHLGKCCLTYGCPAARNFFLDRWEAPLPTSPQCNARCLGCISLQPSGCCPSTQDRINFVPTVNELCGIAVPHLQHAPNPIVSFGQGCEGEPLLQGKTIAAAVARMRKETDRGTINLNSNGSLPEMVARIADSGLDSIRISLNSAQEIYYNRYYRPQNYAFSDVMQSIAEMKQRGRFVSLNYFVLPGFSDSEPEFEALCKLIETYSPDLIQLRNLNIDPEWYQNTLQIPGPDRSPSSLPTMTIRRWHSSLKEQFPKLRFGYFNPQVNRTSL